MVTKIRLEHGSQNQSRTWLPKLNQNIIAKNNLEHGCQNQSRTWLPKFI